MGRHHVFHEFSDLATLKIDCNELLLTVVQPCNRSDRTNINDIISCSHLIPKRKFGIRLLHFQKFDKRRPSILDIHNEQPLFRAVAIDVRIVFAVFAPEIIFVKSSLIFAVDHLLVNALVVDIVEVLHERVEVAVAKYEHVVRKCEVFFGKIAIRC